MSVPQADSEMVRRVQPQEMSDKSESIDIQLVMDQSAPVQVGPPVQPQIEPVPLAPVQATDRRVKDHKATESKTPLYLFAGSSLVVLIISLLMVGGLIHLNGRVSDLEESYETTPAFKGLLLAENPGNPIDTVNPQEDV
jgi:hypothetical protein